MRALNPSPLAIWAVRETLRRPLEGLLTAAALTTLVIVAAAALLLPRALSDTAAFLLKDAPSLVVRRVTAGGWAPIPPHPSVRAAGEVLGVIGVQPRVWGTVNGPDGPVTAWAVEGKMAPGEAMVGPGIDLSYGQVDEVDLDGPGGRSGRSGRLSETETGADSVFLALDGAVSMTVRVVGRWPDRASPIAHDLVLLHPDDARRLLGMPSGYASDLAVTVFHEGEAEAVCPDLAAAFPWPVRMTTRTDALGRQLTISGRWGGIAGMALLPALLGLALLIAASVRGTMGRRRHIGLLKALGWTTPDIVRLQLYRALFVGLPATALGLAAAHVLVFWPGAAWLGFVLPAWESRPPMLYLNPAGSLSVFLQVAALVLIPYLTAVLWPAIRLAAADPEGFLRDGSPG